MRCKQGTYSCIQATIILINKYISIIRISMRKTVFGKKKQLIVALRELLVVIFLII